MEPTSRITIFKGKKNNNQLKTIDKTVNISLNFLEFTMNKQKHYYSTNLKIANEINNLWKNGIILTPKETWEYIKTRYPDITITGSRRIHRIALPDIKKNGGWRKIKK